MRNALFRAAESDTLTDVPLGRANPSSAFLLTAAVLLALLHAVLAVTATVEKSMTADEIAHLTAGLSYNVRGDYRLQPENGNLPQRLAAWPMTLLGAPLPPASLEFWKTADVWNYGHRLFYGQGIATGEWLFLGRAMIALVSAGLGLLIFFWSRRLFGLRGGFVSLVLFVFCPAFLAHGALTTSDVVMTFFFVAALGAWWRHLEQPGATWAIVSGVTLGLAFVAKFSAVLLPPMLGLSGIVWAIATSRAAGWRRPIIRLVRSAAWHVLAVWVVIWMFYGFRFSAFAPEMSVDATFNHGWGAMLTVIGLPAKVIWWLREWHLLPEAWLYGLTFVLQFSRARGAFLSGEYSVTGWPEFFPFAFLIKTTVPLLLILATGVVVGLTLGWRKRNQGGANLVRRLVPLAPLAALFAVYGITSITSNLNIGHRHILPLYPVLFIAAGWLGRWLDWRRPGQAVWLMLLVIWHGAESLRIRPHYLAYFNQMIGGPENGWRHLVDSSLDWGQDLPGLKTWLDEHGRGEKVYLAYFGTGDPAYEGIRAVAMPMLPQVGPPRDWYALSGGIYALSATMLQHVYSNIRGPWTPELEQEYQKLRPIEASFLAYHADPARRAELSREAPAANWENGWKRYEHLRLARLAHYLRVRPPDAMIGYSILVFRLTPSEIDAAVGGSVREWSALLQRAAAAAPIGRR